MKYGSNAELTRANLQAARAAGPPMEYSKSEVKRAVLAHDGQIGMKLKQRVKTGELTEEQALEMLKEAGSEEAMNSATAGWLKRRIAARGKK